MAKIIKYQFATEIIHNVIVQVPLLDEDGNPVTQEVVIPVTEEVTIPVYDENGEPLLDVNGEPITEVVTQPVYDENGEPVVEITYEPVLVDEIQQEIEVVLTDAIIVCPTEKVLNANLPIAQKEAYNGKITVEGEFDPEPETPSGDSVWDELDAAYQRGVDSV
jgi:hypothetical protein